MNFQEARNIPGKFVSILGTAIRFELKEGNFGPYGLGDIRDANGEEQGVLFASSDKSPLPSTTCVNQMAGWGIKYDANTQNYKAYFNGLVGQNQQQPQQRRLASQQRPSAAPQSQKPPQGDVQVQIRRGNALNAVMSATDLPCDMISDYLKAGVVFIETGVWNLLSQNQALNSEQTEYDEPSPSDDEVPF